MPDAFSAQSQAWLDHCFAFLTINYRGSTTFGREFQEQIWGDLGHWEVGDVVAAREWLVREGIAEPGRIFLTGRAYGGYLTLQALGKAPDLWAGGMGGAIHRAPGAHAPLRVPHLELETDHGSCMR